MPSYTIADKQIAEEQLYSAYEQAKDIHSGEDWTDLDLIFRVGLDNRVCFPGIKMRGQQSPQLYLERWVKQYCDAVKNPPSKRSANPKTTCTDPAIRAIVQATQNMTDAEAADGEGLHNLFMSAENAQGNLLEQYIAENIRPYGFLWCEGNILHATDFCNTNGSCLLQIKNKYNTENSSSSNIREGTAIEKWYRLGVRTRNGVKFPDYKWDDLNVLIDTYKTEGTELPKCHMTEDGYLEFLKKVAGENHSLITSL